MEALELAQSECGSDILVVETKRIKEETPTSKALYEVTVGIKEDIDNPSVYKLKEYKECDQTVSSSKDFQAVKKEISDLSEKIKNLQEILIYDSAKSIKNIDIPKEFLVSYKKMLHNEISNKYLQQIISLTKTYMPESMKQNPNSVNEYFKLLLSKMLHVKKEEPFKEQKVMMLVGPTGVGKTTTLAKLASRWAYLSEKKYKVGIITLDTYRIGAYEQLFHYARMMRLRVKDVVDVEDFNEILESFKDCDVVLVDSAGGSPRDKQKLGILKAVLEKSVQKIDVSLVLSAGVKLDDLKDIYDGYSFLGIDNLIFTKFDETKKYGNVFSFFCEIEQPLSYVSVGQDVPYDLHEASGDFLSTCIFEGLKEEYVR
ncbi:MAG: flagellar biosynthesis protein FlhF [Campylobacteraceae bacterium]|nr:flagellar biosynthesis protein FlhF [Campylobacteraceae bacterium]